MEERVYENVFYFRHLNEIGGTEQFLYYLSLLYKDFVVFYSDPSSSIAQINRLGNNVEVHKYNGGVLKCERFFANYNADILDKVEAKEYIQVIHLNYKLQERVPVIHKKITKFIGVSKSVCKAFEELTGRTCECIYNPCVVEKPRKVLKLISATRLSSEKGRDEMIKLGEFLDNAGIPYLWLVFTNDWNVINNPNIIYMSPRLDIDSYIAGSDYLVQLSSSEAYCFSVVQAEMLGVPVIVRDLEVWKEIGLKDKENAFILNYDMSDIPVDEIYKGLKDFKYSPPKSEWDKYLNNKSEYDPEKEVEVTPLCKFWDIEDLCWREKGVSFKCNEKRKNRLRDLGLV